jgi:adenine-specific DNA-methyltransferase
MPTGSSHGAASSPATDGAAPPRLPLTSADPLGPRYEELKALFPMAVTDGRVDLEKLRALMGDAAATGPERYGLSWAGKSDALKTLRQQTTATLLPAPSESEKWDTTGHAIIEGDNLEVLKVLQHAYHGKVKLIYIDPPYNTGGDFIYPDDYAEGLNSYLQFTRQANEEGVKLTTNVNTSGRYHSRWLTMMYPRLFLARNLLRENGVIFISIDDHEVHNLRLVMDEIFGEENFIEAFVWKKSYGGGAKEQFAVRQHEHCLLYGRSADALDEFWLPPDPSAEARYYKYRDEHVDKRGPYRIKPLEATKSMDERANLVFPIPAPDGTEILPKRQWWWSKDRVMRVLADNGLVFTKTDSGYSVSYKQYLIKEDGEQRGAKPFSVIDGFYTQNGTEDLRVLFNDEVVVQFPKPVGLIKRFLQIGTDADAVVLDFFAGSGTTAQAVFELNKEDGGSRKFILVQLPEPTGRKDFPTIAEITKERVRRVIRKMESADAGNLALADGPRPDLGFKVFKLAPSNFSVWDPSLAPQDAAGLGKQWELTADNVRADANEQALLHELMLKCGLPLSSPIQTASAAGVTVYLLDEGRLLICLGRELTREALRAMIDLKPQSVLCLDVGFKGRDALKVNAQLEFASHDIQFRTA